MVNNNNNTNNSNSINLAPFVGVSSIKMEDKQNTNSNLEMYKERQKQDLALIVAKLLYRNLHYSITSVQTGPNVAVYRLFHKNNGSYKF